MSVLSRVRRVGAIAASVTVAFAAVAMVWLSSSIGLGLGSAVFRQAGAFIALAALVSLCLLLAVSAQVSQRKAGPTT